MVCSISAERLGPGDDVHIARALVGEEILSPQDEQLVEARQYLSSSNNGDVRRRQQRNQPAYALLSDDHATAGFGNSVVHAGNAEFGPNYLFAKVRPLAFQVAPGLVDGHQLEFDAYRRKPRFEV